MRCIITYANGPFIGTLDIGVADANDTARIDAAIAGLLRANANTKILRVRFW